MGHSTGGLLAQMIADRGLSAATVAIDPGPFRGVLPLPLSALRSAAPVLANPLNRSRAVTLTLDQFKYGWANALSDEEAERALRRATTWRRPGVALMQMANANLNPWTEAKLDPEEPRPRAAADHRRREGPHGPLGDRQRLLQATAAATRRVTEIAKIPNRGHSLTIDSGWREVADTALAFVSASPSVPAAVAADRLQAVVRVQVEVARRVLGAGYESDGDRPDHAVPAT